MRPSEIEDVCAVIGYTATRVLTAWYGGTHLWVPARFVADHPLCLLLGEPAVRALVREYAGQRLVLPTLCDELRYYRDRVIAERLAAGDDPAAIAIDANVTLRRLQQIRVDLVGRGWLSYAFGWDGPRRRAAGRRGPLAPPGLISVAFDAPRSPPPEAVEGRPAAIG